MTRIFVFIGKNIIFVISCLRQPPFGGWRHHLSPYSGGTMVAVERKPYDRASPGGKQANRPVGRLKCTPSAYGTSPGGGGFSTLMPRDAYEFRS